MIETFEDLSAKGGFETHHGIQVLVVGEDLDRYVALGHHEARHTLQAFNSLARSLLGLDDLLDGWGTGDPARWKEVLGKIEPAWAVLITTCDVGGGADHDPDDCFRCRELEDSNWWMDWGVKQGTAGAFPVMALSL